MSKKYYEIEGVSNNKVLIDFDQNKTQLHIITEKNIVSGNLKENIFNLSDEEKRISELPTEESENLSLNTEIVKLNKKLAFLESRLKLSIDEHNQYNNL